MNVEINGKRKGKGKREREEADSSNMSTGAAWYFTMAHPPQAQGPPARVARRSYDATSYITLRPLTKDSWWDGSLQDRIIWVVICRRRCWFFSWMCCHVRVRPPAAKGPTGPSTHDFTSSSGSTISPSSSLSLSLFLPATTAEYFLFSRITCVYIYIYIYFWPSRSDLPSHCIRILLSSLSIFNLLSDISRLDL